MLEALTHKTDSNSFIFMPIKSHEEIKIIVGSVESRKYNFVVLGWLF